LPLGCFEQRGGGGVTNHRAAGTRSHPPDDARGALDVPQAEFFSFRIAWIEKANVIEREADLLSEPERHLVTRRGCQPEGDVRIFGSESLHECLAAEGFRFVRQQVHVVPPRRK
jgi:hypothetical protein